MYSWYCLEVDEWRSYLTTRCRGPHAIAHLDPQTAQSTSEVRGHLVQVCSPVSSCILFFSCGLLKSTFLLEVYTLKTKEITILLLLYRLNLYLALSRNIKRVFLRVNDRRQRGREEWLWKQRPPSFGFLFKIPPLPSLLQGHWFLPPPLLTEVRDRNTKTRSQIQRWPTVTVTNIPRLGQDDGLISVSPLPFRQIHLWEHLWHAGETWK